MMERSRVKHILTVLSGLFLVAVIFASGAYFGYYKRPAVEKVIGIYSQEPPAHIDEEINFAPFWEAWNLIESKYVSNDGVSRQEMVWGAIAGLAESLGDPYTVFFPPEDMKIFESQITGSFEGVGMEIGMRKGILTVIAPLKDTPAYKAGIKSGDKIIKIDGESTADLLVEEAVMKIRGPKDTEVTLTVLRNGEEKTQDISIKRGVIEIPVIETEGFSREGEKSDKGVGALEDGIFVIRLFNFNENALTAFRSALREMAFSGSNKLVLDLRSNPGGYLEVAVDIASWFLPMGDVVVREKFSDDNERLYRSKGYYAFKDMPVVVLVNEGSASASEILAGALRDHGAATLVGKKTFGKGSVQELINITPDTALKVTIARWLTPNGNSISEIGLTPDVEVDFTAEDFEAGRDPQMERAIELLKK